MSVQLNDTEDAQRQKMSSFFSLIGDTESASKPETTGPDAGILFLATILPLGRHTTGFQDELIGIAKRIPGF